MVILQKQSTPLQYQQHWKKAYDKVEPLLNKNFSFFNPENFDHFYSLDDGNIRYFLVIQQLIHETRNDVFWLGDNTWRIMKRFGNYMEQIALLAATEKTIEPATIKRLNHEVLECITALRASYFHDIMNLNDTSTFQKKKQLSYWENYNQIKAFLNDPTT